MYARKYVCVYKSNKSNAFVHKARPTAGFVKKTLHESPKKSGSFARSSLPKLLEFNNLETLLRGSKLGSLL